MYVSAVLIKGAFYDETTSVLRNDPQEELQNLPTIQVTLLKVVFFFFNSAAYFLKSRTVRRLRASTDARWSTLSLVAARARFHFADTAPSKTAF